MNLLKHWKKSAIMAMTALTLTCSFAVPVMAHCHSGGSHCSTQKGVYCPYHDTYHTKKTNCKNYCPKHKTIHENGKKHHANHHH